MSRRDNQTFDIGQWCDYARGLLDAETESHMQRHLESHPADRRMVAALRRVGQLADADRAASPPEWAVRSAKAIGGLMGRRQESRPSMLRRLAMAVSFDSLANPALAGVRDMQAQDRHLVYDVEGYRVDLRVEPEVDFQGAVFVGQLMRTDGDDVEPMADVPVLAVREQSILGQAKTGPFGEFQTAGMPGSNLGFRLLVDDEVCLDIEVGHNEVEGNHSGESA